MKSALLSEVLKVALRVREDENGVIQREQISKLARSLIEGEEGEKPRNRIRNLKDSASQVSSQAASSAKSLAKVVEIWKNHCQRHNYAEN